MGAGYSLRVELERMGRMTLKQLCDDFGLTPEGIEHALKAYQTIICEITHGMLSKLTYDARLVLDIAQERWCESCELKNEEQAGTRGTGDGEGQE